MIPNFPEYIRTLGLPPAGLGASELRIGLVRLVQVGFYNVFKFTFATGFDRIRFSPIDQP